MLKNTSGTALPEYSMFMAIVTIPILCILMVFCSRIDTRQTVQINKMNIYAVQPQTLECSAGMVSSC